MKRRKSSGGGGANWMDTYGDMVTLLLTFFVMLYAMSSLDQQKWEIFVKSIYPSSSDKQEIAINQPIDEGTYDVNGNIEMEELVDDEMETLYLVLAEQFNSMGIEGVTLSRGEDYTFIAFEDKTFFEGDSSELTEQGGQTLDVFCQTIAPLKDKISQINIMGHTSQGDPERPNTEATYLRPSGREYSFCPPWQEAYPLRFAMAQAIVRVPFLCSPKYFMPRMAAQF